MDNILTYSNIALWVIQIVVIFALILIFRQFGKVYLNSSESIVKDGIPIGRQIPAFIGYSPSLGKSVDQTEIFYDGKPTLISFISLHCPACEDLIPHWNKAYLKHQGEINFLSIVIGSERDGIEKLLSKNISGTVIVDQEDKILHDFNVRVTPFAFITDKNGIVKEKGLCNDTSHIDFFVNEVINEGNINDDIKIKKGVKIHA